MKYLAALLPLALAACDPPSAPATQAQSPAVTLAHDVGSPEPVPSFTSLEYVLTYGAMPPASAGLVLQGGGDATLRFDGNQTSRLAPVGAAGTRAGHLSAGRRRKLEDALALAAITDSVPMAPTPGPTATGRLSLRRGDKLMVVEFPLDETPPRWRPLRQALFGVLVELLAAH